MKNVVGLVVAAATLYTPADALRMESFLTAVSIRAADADRNMLDTRDDKHLAYDANKVTNVVDQMTWLRPHEQRSIVAGTLSDLLSPMECKKLIMRAESAGLNAAEVHSSTAPLKKSRVVLEDAVAAEEIWQRLRPYVP